MCYRGDLYELASFNKTLTSVNIELTQNCNWRCKHCYISSYNNESRLTLEVLNKLFARLRKMGVIDILFTGGEIFLREDILEVLQLARDYFFDVSLFTNISLLNKNMIKSLDELNISKVSGTVFSMDHSIHDNITRVKNSLNKTLKNLNILKKYRIPVEIKTIIMSVNKYEYETVAEYCKSMAFEFLPTTSIFPRHNKDTNPLDLCVDENYLAHNLAKIDSFREFTKQIKREDMYICNSTRYSLSIKADGTINPCNNLIVDIGNVLSDDIEIIWKESKFLNKVQDLQWKDLKECNSCNVREYCMRCGGVNTLYNEDIMACNKLENIHAQIRYRLQKEGKGNKNGKIYKTLC